MAPVVLAPRGTHLGELVVEEPPPLSEAAAKQKGCVCESCFGSADQVLLWLLLVRARGFIDKCIDASLNHYTTPRTHDVNGGSAILDPPSDLHT